MAYFLLKGTSWLHECFECTSNGSREFTNLLNSLYPTK